MASQNRQAIIKRKENFKKTFQVIFLKILVLKTDSDIAASVSEEPKLN